MLGAGRLGKPRARIFVAKSMHARVLEEDSAALLCKLIGGEFTAEDQVWKSHDSRNQVAMKVSYNGVLAGGSCKLYLSPRLRKSKALELHVGVLEEVSKHLAQAGERIEILKSSTDWKQCYRTWEPRE